MSFDEINISGIKGFLSSGEADCLYNLALEVSQKAPCLEIGSYCGKSAICLGKACKENRAVLFSLDHHQGSEEQQPGEAYFDAELLNKETGLVDTLGFFRKTIRNFGLEDAVIPVIGRSETVGMAWLTPLSLIFIDGSHAYASVQRDYEIWSKHLLGGGYLLFHDIFPDPAAGGQAPYQIYQIAVSSGLYEEMPMCESLGILKKK